MQTLHEKITDILRQEASDPDAAIKICNKLDAACANGIWYDYALFVDGHVEVYELNEAAFVAVYIQEYIMDDMCTSHEIERDGNTVSAQAYTSYGTSHTIEVNSDLSIFVKSISEISTDRETFKSFVDFKKVF